MFWKVYVPVCMHIVLKNASYFFATFFCNLKSFLNENEIMETTLDEGLDVTQLFFYAFFFIYSQKML